MKVKGQQRQLDLPQFVRLAPNEAVPDLGPLARLTGTWTGNLGWNLIAVPTPGRPDLFTLLVRPYYEMITFTPLGVLVPDRGASEILNIFGLEYSLRVSDLLTHEPLHLENGMWLYTNDPQAPHSPTIVRQAVIPHGNSVLALGTSQRAAGPPIIPERKPLPVGTPDPPRPGYDEPYTRLQPPTVPGPPFDMTDANAVLREAIKDQDIRDTITLSVSTQPPGGGGGIVNIPFIQQNANTTSFSATFWIETVVDEEAGVQFDQLQYSQQTNLAFIKCGSLCSDEGKGLIVWPHVNVNTLVRQ